MVKPILLYGCEVWGYRNNEILDRVHLKFCILLLKSKATATVYGELRRYQIEIDIKVRIISF